MSYILDALKKSDQQRQRGATPTLQSSPSVAVASEPRRAWLYPALALVLAAIAFAVGSFAPWHKPSSVTATPPAPAAIAAAPAAPAPLAAPTPVAVPATPPAPAAPRATATLPAQPAPAAPPVAPQKEAAAAAPAKPTPAPAPAPRTREVEPAAPASARTAQTPVPAAGLTAEANAPAKDAKGPEARVPTLAELPPSIRSELPPMTISVHAYSSTPKDRLVGVNDKLLREGDSITPDLVIDRITPDGMILSYKGTKFQRGLR